MQSWVVLVVIIYLKIVYPSKTVTYLRNNHAWLSLRYVVVAVVVVVVVVNKIYRTFCPVDGVIHVCLAFWQHGSVGHGDRMNEVRSWVTVTISGIDIRYQPILRLRPWHLIHGFLLFTDVVAMQFPHINRLRVWMRSLRVLDVDVQDAVCSAVNVHIDFKVDEVVSHVGNRLRINLRPHAIIKQLTPSKTLRTVPVRCLWRRDKHLSCLSRILVRVTWFEV